MITTDFNNIASRYEQDSLVQRSAAEKLINLLDIQRDDDVLDLGCGAGNLTRKLRTATDGAVSGIDLSEGMIREAQANRGRANISFRVQSVDQLADRDTFDVIFCNSAFQWFRDPGRALGNCYQALKPGGRMGVQAPATQSYCPNFLAAMDAVARDPRTAGSFAGFQSPWLFLDTDEEYAALFRHSGFDVFFARLEEQRSLHPPDEAMTIFESGAAAGYLNRDYYPTAINESYASDFRRIARESFHGQMNETGKVELVFNRIYLIAGKKSKKEPQ